MTLQGEIGMFLIEISTSHVVQSRIREIPGSVELAHYLVL